MGLPDSNFIVGDLGAKNTNYPLGSKAAVSDSVSYRPFNEGADTVIIPIYSDYPNYGVNDAPTLTLIGIGVEPHVFSNGYKFGSWRVDSSSPQQTITIVNRGSDTTAVDSVTIVNTGELSDSDFIVTLDTLPPNGGKFPVRLDYEGSPDGGNTLLSFSVKFRPTSLGAKMLVVRIHTVDSIVLFDTLTGSGVEPLVVVEPQSIKFDTIHIPKGKALPAPVTLPFQVLNNGTMEGELDTLFSTDTVHFSLFLSKKAGTGRQSLAVGSSAIDSVTFSPTAEGNFIDTVYVVSNTRYGLYTQSTDTTHRIILKAEVRTGAIGGDSISFGTITTCDPVADSVWLRNPYPVMIHIDSIKFISDTGGFSIRNSFVQHNINIAANDSFSLPLIYSFPPDSLNGTQQLKLVLYQRSGEGENAILDTETAYVERQQRVFALQAILPAFHASAGDISPMRLPITVTGPRAGVNELNSWTLSLHFSNDLFEPVGVDTTGALTVPGDSTYFVKPYWDQASRTYTIIVTSSAVADSSKIRNDLLLTLLMRAYLTTDTAVTVTPTFKWTQRPCAYNLQAFTLDVPYADDCGNQIIREAMLGQTQAINITSLWPNPTDASSDVSVGYDAIVPVVITCRVFNEIGEETGRINKSLPIGNGTLAIPAELLPKSGLAFVRIEAVQPGSSTLAGPVRLTQSFKIEILK